MKEIWKDIQGYEGLYQVSNLGNVKSFYFDPPIILKSCKNQKGYLHIVLNKNGIKKTVRIHRLVAQAFVDNPNNKEQVNHIDGIKINNNACNLEWVSNQENISHASKNGLLADVTGNNNPRCRAINQYDLNNKFIKQWKSFYEIKKSLGIDRSCIWRCCIGKFQQSHNYIWRYAD